MAERALNGGLKIGEREDTHEDSDISLVGTQGENLHRENSSSPMALTTVWYIFVCFFELSAFGATLPG